MKFHTLKPNKKMKKGEKKELESKLTTLDKVILDKCKSGSDMGSIQNTCRPYKNKYGLKVFAPLPTVRVAVAKLQKLGLLASR